MNQSSDNKERKVVKMEEARMYTKEMDLVDAVLDSLREMHMSKAELA